eukprot:gene11852-8448_t
MSTIDQLLNQVPYRNRPRVKADIEAATIGAQKMGALTPKIGNFDGAENKLVFLSGTIPIFYGGATYNIPVDIYLPMNFPTETPFMYVRPTGNMIIKQNHRHVDMNGFVYLPYLHEWNTSHSLVPLIEVASSVFSIEPPLFTKPAAAPVPPPAAVNMSSHSAVAATPSVAAYPAAVAAVPAPVTATPATATPATSNAYSFGGLSSAALFATSMRPAVAAVPTPAPVTAAATPAPAAYSTATVVGPATSATASTTAAMPNPYFSTYAATAAVSTTPAVSAAIHQQTQQQNQLIAQQVAEKRAKLKHDVTQVLRQRLQAKYETLREDILREMLAEQYLNRSKAEAEQLEAQYRQTFLPQLQASVTLLHQKVTDVKRLRAQPDPAAATAATAAPVAVTAEASGKETAAPATADAAAATVADSADPAAASAADAPAAATATDATAPATSSQKPSPSPSTASLAETAAAAAAAAAAASPEAQLQPVDDLSQQITKLQGDLLAFHDAFYVYERALLASPTVVDLKSFSKEVRDISRQEFLCKAHLRKIYAQLRQWDSVANAAVTAAANTTAAFAFPSVPTHNVYVPSSSALPSASLPLQALRS